MEAHQLKSATETPSAPVTQKPTMSQVLHTSLLEVHSEALNEIDNLKHDYAIVSAQRNELREQVKVLLAACKEMNAATLAGGPYDVDKASVRIRTAIKYVKEQQ